MKTSIEFTRVNNDVNGNPRYVCHFLDLLSDADHEALYTKFGKDLMSTNRAYELALKKARSIGGRKFHNKQLGGGIVFQSYNIQDTERNILELKGESTHA